MGLKKKRITIELSDQEWADIQRFLDMPPGELAEGLSLQSLTTMLLRDVALTESRPGSWEGSNMIEVLRGHGYY
jgi:hypothetical protein